AVNGASRCVLQFHSARHVLIPRFCQELALHLAVFRRRDFHSPLNNRTTFGVYTLSSIPELCFFLFDELLELQRPRLPLPGIVTQTRCWIWRRLAPSPPNPAGHHRPIMQLMTTTTHRLKLPI